MSNKSTALTVQKWGNSLAVRIPAKLARKGHFYIGTVVEVSLEKDGLMVKPTQKSSLTLEERLKQFNIKEHGGEAMESGLVGKEKF